MRSVLCCWCVCSAGRWLTLWCSTLRWQSLGIGGQSMMERRAFIRPTHCLWPPQGWAYKQDTYVQSQKHSLAVQPGCKPCLLPYVDMAQQLTSVWLKYSGDLLHASHIAHAPTLGHSHSPNFFILSNSLFFFFFFSPALRLLQVDLDVTLPGEGGKDRPFKVSIRFVSLVSWHMLHEVLTGRSMPDPLELDKPISTNPVHAVDVVLRHLPSMK